MSARLRNGAVEVGMQRVSRVFAAGLVMVLALGASACGSGSPVPEPHRPTEAEITWRELGAWSGRLNYQTESFEVATFAMRLRWQTLRETTPGAGHLIVTLHSAASGRLLQTLVDTRGLGAASVNVAEEPHLAYLAIAAENVEWQMTLEQGYASRPPSPGSR